MIDKINISLPNKADYVTIARLAASSLANNIGFDVEDVEDIKLAVGEAVNNAILHGNGGDAINVSFIIKENELQIEVLDKGLGFNLENYKKPEIEEYEGHGLGIFIMESLMDEVTIETNIGNGTKITLIKRID